jgi:hypothetical protein
VSAFEGVADSFDIQIVTQEDSDIGAPFGMNGFLSSSCIGVIDDIVMEEAGCVNGFDETGHGDVFIP